jgi:5-methylcytosine-specific restriction endonuclease McrA
MIAFVLHDGIDVQRVAHTHRPPSALQRTALQALHDRCADIDCRAFGNLEIDHLTPWTDGGTTRLDNLAPLCGATHDAKTHRGRDLHRIPGSHLVTATPPGPTTQPTTAYQATA